MCCSAPHVVHTLPEDSRVRGITSAGSELFVLRRKDRDQVEVYSMTTHAILRHLNVPGLNINGMTDLTSCSHNSCLYISDCSSKCVRKVPLQPVKLLGATRWLFDEEPWSLSVTPQFSVIVAFHQTSKVKEFSSAGKELREIRLPSGVAHPWQAIRLPDGQILLCHGDVDDAVHRVCIMNNFGVVKQAYGGAKGSASIGQMCVPYHMAVDKDGFVFVVDRENKRVLLLSPALSYVREILSADQLKWFPRKLCLDAERRRLYVVDSAFNVGAGGGRVLVVGL